MKQDIGDNADRNTITGKTTSNKKMMINIRGVISQLNEQQDERMKINRKCNGNSIAKAHVYIILVKAS